MRFFRTHYLIDRDFQLRYALLLASTSIIVTVIIGGLFLYSLKESYDVLIQAGMTQYPEVLSLIQHWKSFLSYTLVMILGMLVIFLTLLGILITHKMAGPILVLKRKLRDITEGKWGEPMHLRKGDEFQEVKDTFNQMRVHLIEEAKGEIGVLESSLPHISDLEVSSKLKALISKKKEKF